MKFCPVHDSVYVTGENGVYCPACVLASGVYASHIADLERLRDVVAGKVRSSADIAEVIDCTCVNNCGEGDECEPGEHTFEAGCTACSHLGEFHSHDDDPCPIHVEAVVG